MGIRPFEPAWRTLCAAATERFCLLHKFTSFKNRGNRGGRFLKILLFPRRRGAKKNPDRQTSPLAGSIYLPDS